MAAMSTLTIRAPRRANPSWYIISFRTSSSVRSWTIGLDPSDKGHELPLTVFGDREARMD
ncbi:MAG TPA: hypothetical protein DIU14_10555 [Actinobacteria bacterium]|nr:hypothetical protein [Actinomycetota bacterium]